MKKRLEAVDRLRNDAGHLQQRLDRRYVDRVDGRISAEMHDRMASIWREERERHLQHLERLHDADDAYIDIDNGIALLELGRNAHKTFSIQSLGAKNAALNLLVSNSVWAAGSLRVESNERFGMLEQIQGPVTGQEP